MNTNSKHAATEVIQELNNLADAERAVSSQRFFKTGKGQYGEGDTFIGVTVPKQRIIAKKYIALSLSEVISLLHEPIHEMRLTALIIMTYQFESADSEQKKRIYQAYLANTDYINNWDLVDVSTHKIVGPYLVDRLEKMEVLTKLARSDNMWERRIAIVSTLYNSAVRKSSTETLTLAKMLLDDTEDLMHKAVGWALREVGKQVSESELTDFLDKYTLDMPRTSLRYSIERLPPEQRKHYMELK